MPSAKTGRPIASYDVTAVGKGVQNLGQGIADLGVGISNAQEHRDKIADFETERRFQEFKWNQKLNLDESIRSVQPGQADGFADRWVGGYKKGSDEFLASVPESLKGKYGGKLEGTERELWGSAHSFARKEQARFSLNQIEDVKNTYASRAQAGEPLDNIRTDFENLVSANPFLDPIEKDEAIRKGYSGLEESHVLGRIERGDSLSDILKDLHGGQPDTDENPETRARPFSRRTTDSKPVSQFESGINDAINQAAEANEVDPGVLATFAQIESSGRAGVRTGSYKGLFQLSDDEFRKYGGEGSIYDPVANANAAARKLKAEAEQFEASYGRAPSVLDLYMVHQQGEGGYAAHMANPERAAWENMASTAEGRQKGEKWAKAAIWGNIPKDVRKRFPGGVESVTSADFVEMWGEKVRRIGGVDAAPANDDTNVAFFGPYRHLPSDRRRTLIEKAKIASRTQAEQAVKDSIEEIRNTGIVTTDENGDNALDRAKLVLTPKQFNDQKIRWQEAELEHQTFSDLYALTEDGLQDRLRDVEPKVGEDLYEVKARLYDKALTQVEKIRELREKDPAASVADFPEVQAAEQGARENPGDPQFIQELARARIDAQAKLGNSIPENLRSPITKQEARVLMAPVRGLEGKALREALTGVREQIEGQYGPYARAAAVEAVSLIYGDKAIGEEIEGMLTRSMKGLAPTAAQQRRVEFLTETNLATRAFGGDFVGDPVRQYQGRPEGPETGMPVQVNPANAYRMRKPPKAAIDALIANPQLRDQFEEHYGAGAADRVLVQ